MLNLDLDSHTPKNINRGFGIALLGGAVGVCFFMAHHPTGEAALGGMASSVHAAMLIMILLLATGMTHFARYCGLQSFWVLAALLSYLTASVFNAFAAAINGFVVPQLRNQGAERVGHDVLDLAWEMNQTLALLAAIGTATAYSLWAATLLRHRQWWLGFTGLAAAGSTVVLLSLSGGEMQLRTAILIYPIQVLWAGLVGFSLIRSAAPELQ